MVLCLLKKPIRHVTVWSSDFNLYQAIELLAAKMFFFTQLCCSL